MEKDLKQLNSDIIRVVINGPESTGKTTLTKQLAEYFNTEYVSEFARDYLQEKWDSKKEVCSKEDLIVIVKEQVTQENELSLKANKILLLDTNIITTINWSITHFDGYCDPWIIKQAEFLKYDHYLITNIESCQLFFDFLKDLKKPLFLNSINIFHLLTRQRSDHLHKLHSQFFLQLQRHNQTCNLQVYIRL